MCVREMNGSGIIDRAISGIHKLIPAGTRLLAALSGGADSTFLLRLLLMAGYDVVAVHCNFHLRGDESMRDMDFCRSLCADLDVPLRIVHFDVEAFRSGSGMGVEEACRKLRYDKFREILADSGLGMIAVAHNADDNIETLLLNLLRGAGVTGLRGMLPLAGDVVRPLLGISRREILEMLSFLNQDYITDSSNLESDYRRNFLRLEVIPLLRSRWPGLDKSIAATIMNLRGDELILDHYADAVLKIGESDSLSLAMLRGLPDPGWAIHRWGRRLGMSSHIVREIAMAVKSADPVAGKKWRLRSGLVVASSDALSYLPASRLDDTEPGGVTDVFNVEKMRNSEAVMQLVKTPGPSRTLWIPFGPDRCVVRRPQPGDRMEPLGMRGSQLVADILRDARLSYEDKKNAMIIAECSSGEIIWIPGIKRSRHFLVADDDPWIYRFDPVVLHR